MNACYAVDAGRQLGRARVAKIGSTCSMPPGGVDIYLSSRKYIIVYHDRQTRRLQLLEDVNLEKSDI
jgi:hypothetical protein